MTLKHDLTNISHFPGMQISVLHQCFHLAWYPNKITSLQAFNYWSWMFYYLCFLYIKLIFSKSYISFPGLKVRVLLQHIKSFYSVTQLYSARKWQGVGGWFSIWQMILRSGKEDVQAYAIKLFAFKWNPAAWDPQHSCSLTAHSMYTFNPFIFVFFNFWAWDHKRFSLSNVKCSSW